MLNRRGGERSGAAGGCAAAGLVQQLARIEELRGAGADRGDPHDYRGAADLAHHRARVGDGDHGAVALHAAAAGGDGAGQDAGVFRGGAGGCRASPCWWACTCSAVPFRGSLLLLAVSTCVFLFGALFWGIFISAGARTQVVAYQMGMLTSFLPAFLLSGFVFSIETMPKVIQVITHRGAGALLRDHFEGRVPEGRRAERPVGRAGFPGAVRGHRFSAGDAEDESEGGVNSCGNEFGVILRKEFIQALREPRMRVLLFLPPLLQLHHLRLCREPGRGPRAHRLDGHGPHAARAATCARASRARAASTWWPCRRNEEEVQSVLDRGEAQAVVRVLPGFARDLARGPRRRGAGAAGRHQFQHRVAGFELRGPDRSPNIRPTPWRRQQNRRGADARVPARPVNASVPQVTARSRVWFNPDLRSRNYFVPGVVANIIMHGDADADGAGHRARKGDRHHGAVDGDADAAHRADAGQDAAVRRGGAGGRGAGHGGGAGDLPRSVPRQFPAAAVLLRAAVPDDQPGGGPVPFHHFAHAAAGHDGVVLLLRRRRSC